MNTSGYKETRTAEEIRLESASAAVEFGLPADYAEMGRRQFGRAYWLTHDVMRAREGSVAKILRIHVGRSFVAEMTCQSARDNTAAMVDCATQPGAVDAWLAGTPVFPDDDDARRYQAKIRDMFEVATITGDLERGRPED
jgi:hypothetical protein